MKNVSKRQDGNDTLDKAAAVPLAVPQKRKRANQLQKTDVWSVRRLI